MPPAVGERAPAFRARSQHGETIELADQLPALVVFFPFAFSSICSSELAVLNEADEFAVAGVDVIAISCDSVYSLRAMADANLLGVTLLSDFWPHGQIAREYGCFEESIGAARRSSYLIDDASVIRWVIHHSMSEQRSVELHRRSLEYL